MKKLVSVQPQAVAYNAQVQIAQSECQSELSAEWDEVKSKFIGQKVKRKGHRPRPIKQADAEASNLTDLYHDFWYEALVDGIEKRVEKRVAYVTDLNVRKQGDTYTIMASIWFKPDVQWNKELFMKGLAELFLADQPITEADVAAEVEKRRLQLQFHPNHIKFADDDEPVKENDTLQCEIANDFATGENRLPELHIIKLSDTCPEHIKEALLGKMIGDVAIKKQDVESGTNQTVTSTIKVLHKILVEDVTDEALADAHGHPSVEAMCLNVKRELESRLTKGFEGIFSQYLASNCQLTPLPAAMVFDRAQGALEGMMQQHGQRALLKKLGVRDAQSAINVVLPQAHHEISIESICYEIAKELGLEVTDEHVQALLKEHNMPDTPETRYVATMEVTTRMVKKYYQSKGQDQGEPSLILKPGDTGFANPDLIAKQQAAAKPSNVIQLKP